MHIVEVTTKQHVIEFLCMPTMLYTGDSNYVRPLDSMIESIFDERNPLYSPEMARRYLLHSNNNKPIGRIAVFINKNKAYGFDQPTGGFGFFECIDNQDAANMLFDTAREFLEARGMKAMDGPINLGENDSFWGLLVEGFTMPGFGMNYNPPYYQKLFENYGFYPYFNQITNHLDLTKRFPERFWNIARRVAKNEDYSFRHFNIKESDKYLNDFIEVYNDAWVFHDNFTPMDKKVLEGLFDQAKSFLIEELIWYVYHNEEPVGFLVVFPDINKIIQKLNGNLNFINKLRFYYMAHSPRYLTRGRVVVFGIKPKYQRSGLESGLFYQLKKGIERNPHFKELELSWVGDFNVKMRALQESMGAVRGKHHVTYRYLFDGNEEDKKAAATIGNDTKYAAKNEKRG